MTSRENNQNTDGVKSAEQEALDANRTIDINQTVEMSASELAAGWKAAPPVSYSSLFDAPHPVAAPEIADDALIAPPRAVAPPFWIVLGRNRRWLLLAAAVLAVPLGLTLAGALTSPPHVAGVPGGHLITLQADAPSERTTTLRGLFVSDPSGASRLLAHETEPQDTDGGVRTWITQPALSPDGTQLAFEEQQITIGEDKQSVKNQIWVLPLSGDTQDPPHLVIDLTKQKLKQVVGLTWDSDSSLLFLEDGASYSVATDTNDAPLVTPLDLHGLALAPSADVSATRAPALSEAGTFAYSVQTPSGPQVLTSGREPAAPGPSAAVFALSPTGDKVAFVPPHSPQTLKLYDLARHTATADIPVRWGWSVFGKREITSLRWSPDGSQLAYTVSKPPVPEDEIFVVTPATGEVVQLPYRTGRAAWDWGR